MTQKIALVTGASGGIGAATALILAKNHYAVCVHYHRNQARAEKLVTSIKTNGGKAIAVQADLAVEADIMRLFQTVDRELGSLTALVNNAANILTQSVEETSWQDMDVVFRTNVLGAIACCREAMLRMKTTGGTMVNVSSEAARGGGNNMSAYAASKAAINSFTVGFAREAARHGIRVNAVSPGVIATDVHASATPEQLKHLVQSVPFGRMGKPEEVAQAIAWLLSDEASYVSGSILPISGAR